VNDLTVNRQTPLHIAAIHDHAAIASILIENSVDFTAIDDGRNNGNILTVIMMNTSAVLPVAKVMQSKVCTILYCHICIKRSSKSIAEPY